MILSSYLIIVSFVRKHVYDIQYGWEVDAAHKVILKILCPQTVNLFWKCVNKSPVSKQAASDKFYQLLAHGQWFYSGTPASSTTKTGRHDIAEILLKVALNTINQSIQLRQRDNDLLY
jgi:hypothetical protein